MCSHRVRSESRPTFSVVGCSEKEESLSFSIGSQHVVSGTRWPGLTHNWDGAALLLILKGLIRSSLSLGGHTHALRHLQTLPGLSSAVAQGTLGLFINSMLPSIYSFHLTWGAGCRTSAPQIRSWGPQAQETSQSPVLAESLQSSRTCVCTHTCVGVSVLSVQGPRPGFRERTPKGTLVSCDSAKAGTLRGLGSVQPLPARTALGPWGSSLPHC